MGTNRRYGDRQFDRAIEEAATRPAPVELTEAELDFANHPIITAPIPIPVRAFVRFHEAVIRPNAEAIAWTDRAVQIRWTMHSGAVKTVWVWASAVDRL
jgi:hypothetical protein